MAVGNSRNSMDTLEEVAGVYGTGMANDADSLSGATSEVTYKQFHPHGPAKPEAKLGPINVYLNELVQQQAQISDQIRQVQATGVQLIGQLNQVAGAIAAVEKIMADQAK